MAYEDLLKKFVYKNLFTDWLRANTQTQPFGSPLKQYSDSPAYFLKPEKMTEALSALTPYDLFMKPSSQPIPLQYSTIAFNQGGSPDMLGMPRGTNVMSNILGNNNYYGNPWQGIRSWKELVNSYGDFPIEKIPQAIYEHEAGHTADPRFFMNNRTIKLRERPAQLAEERFWRNIFSDYGQK